MDQPAGPPPPTPSFRTISIGKCYRQTATDRFGNDAKGAIRDRERLALGINIEGLEAPFTWPGLDDDDENDENEEEPHPEDSIYRLVPSTQGYRNNLTALSQAHNLYFVAYQGHIFVYAPRSIPKQTIPRHPDLQIYPEPSREAIYIGGCVDPVTPHTINHIITGYLGEEEIVVACYDDGDVVAYYVREIADYVFSRPDVPQTQKSFGKTNVDRLPRLFFHENVGHSAWGLATHRKSRLIAVSSNRFEVTVFAFALATCQKKSQDVWEFCDCCQTCDSTESGIPRRARNWRIVVALGSHASNLPNVCFVDSEDGQAEKVCAIDIKGFVWMADIWKMFQPVSRMSPSEHHVLQSEEFWPASSRGWGVLALAEESFVPVKNLEEMFGLPETAFNNVCPSGPTCPQPMVNVSECLAAIPDNPCPPSSWGSRGDNANAANATNDVQNAQAENQNGGAGQLDEEEEDMSQGSGEEQYFVQTVEVDGFFDLMVAEYGDSAVLFPPPPAGLQFQQALQDLDEALGQLAYAVQEFQEAISTPDTPELGLAQAQDSEHQGSSASTDERRSSFDRTFTGQHGYSQLSSPPVRLDMAFFPHSGKIQAIPRPTKQHLAFLRRPIEFNENKESASEDAATKSVMERYRFIRTYEKDLELRSFMGDNQETRDKQGGLKEIGVICPNAVTLGCFHERTIRPYFRATSRLSLVLHVPELSLVVFGSPIGRVLLVTPTKLRAPIVSHTKGIWHHGLRVECVLPRQSDEQTLRPVLRPLHGLAIGPVQDDDHANGDMIGQAIVPKRFRLMLHYRNHDILTYEVTREEQTGRLCIF